MRTLSDRTQTPSDQTTNERLAESDVVSVADVLRPVLQAAPEAAALRMEFWDGSATGPPDAAVVARWNRSDALRRVLWMPNELGVARAYVAGDVDLDGDIFTCLVALRRLGLSLRASPAAALRLAVRAARRLGVVGRPPPPPEEEAGFSGWRHSPARDARSVTHHYDVGNDFYRVVLGPSLTYSCARFVTPESTLEEAQAAKYELICRKLGLHERPGARLLDVGCGWGSMALHAATNHGARVVGITLSPQQLEL
ncbi:MAG: cyclopropane-fatty-acyl-phospholipid synthase, partial [Acidimicrobiaceae bacterium]|nr:cyclopropane-fatty-acyl-phospholipid synthase [Acidimicrobiaceae bacterium]